MYLEESRGGGVCSKRDWAVVQEVAVRCDRDITEEDVSLWMVRNVHGEALVVLNRWWARL